jgi:NAD(P)-dependent dehydrogenase (short-subunit alcohol dehydrogenase family)
MLTDRVLNDRVLSDHAVVVAGGGSGLGLGVARHCLAQGAAVAILEVSAEKVAALAAEFGSSLLALRCDVTNLDDLAASRTEVLSAFGRVDVLIGTQGIFDGNVPLVDIPADRLNALFDEIFHVNVLGYIHLAKVFHADLAAAKGAIVLTGSTAAYAADGGGLCYSASKGAVRALVQQLAFEFAPNIRVNGVAPAGIANSQLRGPGALGMDDFKQSDIPTDAFLAMFRKISLLQDLPTPEDHGPLYAFLASRHNTIMTGQMVVADQGMLNRAVLTQPAT